MDQALKQRLVGATVLILLGVILLPMLLSGQPEFSNETRSIEVPDRPPSLSIETRRFPVGDGPTDQPSKVPEPQAREVEPEPLAPAEPAVTQIPVTPQQSEPEAGTDKPARPESVSPASEQSGRYLVQVVSLSNARNANQLSEMLVQDGLPVVMDTMVSNGGTLHRVRLGPYDDIESAQSAIAEVGELRSDLKPRIIDLRPDENAPVTEPSDPLVRWVVQVGSYSVQTNAEQLLARLRLAGFTAYSDAVSDQRGTLHKVRVGPVLERQSAIKQQERLRNELELDGTVMSVD